MQLGLFLKAAGLTLDESLQLWREEMTKTMTLDKFEKQYAYTIRHNYGKEGKRVDYTAYGCVKIVQSHVNPGEQHGCPFKHMDSPHLDSLLSLMAKWKPGSKAKVLEIAKQGHAQLACQHTFEAVHDGDVRATNAQISHPNEYTRLSLELALSAPPPVPILQVVETVVPVSSEADEPNMSDL